MSKVKLIYEGILDLDDYGISNAEKLATLRDQFSNEELHPFDILEDCELTVVITT